ncbi:Siderophore biosynthesis non-ribosomal peptide synthetase [Minicystis rosea]|nr:Siderophore biosynthesis non-ribosomal peptide synthetase [Minicystis rosea]
MTATKGADRIAVRPLRRPGRHAPLFLVSAPGVNALGYVALARCLDPAETVMSVQAHGAGYPPRRDYSPEECAALAAAYLAAVRARQPVGPYHFAGMCDGAHIAFEMARRLEAQGEEVALLGIIDTWPVENSSHYPLVMIESMRKQLAPLDGGERLAWIARGVSTRIRGLGRALRTRLPGNDTAERRPSPRELWRARVWPGESFVPPRYGGRITVLRVRRQPYFRLRDPSLGWASRSTYPVDIHLVPGDHANLLRPPHVAALACALGACLAAARARSSAAFTDHGVPRRA